MLAQPAHLQIDLFPDGIAVPDAIASEFSFAFCDVDDSLKVGLAEQLSEIDQILLEHSGRNFEEFWNTESLSSNILWEEIRTLAKEALAFYELSAFAPHSKVTQYAVEPLDRSFRVLLANNISRLLLWLFSSGK